ncbi:MAG: hypothetical protein AAF125_11465, partial [Chloroflexota bacterium]
MRRKSDVPLQETITIRTTTAMREQMQSVMHRQNLPTEADAWRAAGHFYLDHLSNAVGSRRVMNRDFTKRLDDLDHNVELMMSLILESLVVMLNPLYEAQGLPVPDKSDLLRTIARDTAADWPV